MAVLALAAFLLVPMAESDAAYYNTSGDSVIATEAEKDYYITYENHDYDDKKDMTMSITYTAKLVDSSGTTVSSGVDPSSGDLSNGVSTALTVTAPGTAGTYRLLVTYEVSGSYTNDDGEKVEFGSELKVTDNPFSIKVIQPVKLSVTLKNDSSIDLSGYGLYFYIDGQKIEDSYTTISLEKEGTSSVTYDWIAEPSEGKHTYSVKPAEGGNMINITGLGEEYSFYIGDNSYTVWIAVLVIVVVLLALVMLWVYRKPVKNFGKPKARR